MKKYDELINEAILELETNDELFIDCVNELDSWDGYADGFRGYPMSELDELFCGCKLSEFLEKIGRDFDFRDEYFLDTIYGIESTDDLAGHYRDNVDTGDLLDNIINKYECGHIYIYDNDFESLLDDIIEARDTENENDNENE